MNTPERVRNDDTRPMLQGARSASRMGALNSEPLSSRSEADAFAERRNEVRQDMLRANRAVGMLLVVVLALACVAVYFIYRSGRNQERAEQAEDAATERLWRVSLARARAERTNPQAGHRAAALEAVKTATAIRPSVELRNEAIAALNAIDFETEVEWEFPPSSRGFQFDPDFQFYALRLEAEVVTLLRIADNSLVRKFPRPEQVPAGTDVAEFLFSATGKYLAVRYDEGPMALFETATGRVAAVLGGDGRITKYSWPPSFTADDRTMCLTMSGPDGPFVLYDIEKQEPRRLAVMPSKMVYRELQSQVAVSPRGDLLAWFEGATVRLLDAVSGQVKLEVLGPTAVKVIDWDRRGDRVAFGCGNATLFLLEAASGRLLQMGGRTVQPWVQRFSEDGSLLLTSGRDGVTSLWDVAGARLICQSSEARGVAISRRGDRIGWGVPRSRAGVWKITQPVGESRFQGRYADGATIWQQDLSTDGRRALWSPPTWIRANAIELCDLENNRQGVLRLGRRAVGGFLPGTDRIWLTDRDGLTIHDRPDVSQIPSGGLPVVSRIPVPSGMTPLMAGFSDDGRYVAVACTGDRLMAIDTLNPAAPVTMEQGVRFTADVPGPAGTSGSGALAVSPDGNWIVAGRDTVPGDPAIWDARSGRLVKRLPVAAAHVCFSPDGKWLLTVGIRHTRLWAVGSWQEKWNRDRPASLAGFLGSGAFSRDGSMLAWTSDLDVMEISNPETGDSYASFHWPRLYPLTGLRFSADGGLIFAAGPEGRTQLLDLGRLRRDHLAGLGLDWSSSGPVAESVAARPDGLPGWLPVLLGLAPLGIAGALGVLLFRRQGRLAREFMEAAEVASQKERELAAERELGELKSRFVTTVSHEFRTPLGITMSAVELLRHYEDRLPPGEKDQLLEDIHGATKNMAGLMEQVLVLGRVDAGKLGFRPAPLTIDPLVRKLADECSSASDRRCPIEWTAENDLSGATGDPALIRHILTNLLSNAVKYSPEGSPVSVTGRRDGRDIVFTVRDRGIGIPEEEQSTLFEAFHRCANVGETPGTGLGLFITKRCAELHGGSVSFTSRQGEGTEFVVRLPLFGSAS